MTQEELDSLMAQDADSLGEGLDDVKTTNRGTQSRSSA